MGDQSNTRATYVRFTCSGSCCAWVGFDGWCVGREKLHRQPSIRRQNDCKCDHQNRTIPHEVHDGPETIRDQRPWCIRVLNSKTMPSPTGTSAGTAPPPSSSSALSGKEGKVKDAVKAVAKKATGGGPSGLQSAQFDTHPEGLCNTGCGVADAGARSMFAAAEMIKATSKDGYTYLEGSNRTEMSFKHKSSSWNVSIGVPVGGMPIQVGGGKARADVRGNATSDPRFKYVSVPASALLEVIKSSPDAATLKASIQAFLQNPSDAVSDDPGFYHGLVRQARSHFRLQRRSEQRQQVVVDPVEEAERDALDAELEALLNSQVPTA